MPSIIRNLFRRSSNNSNNQAQQTNRQFQPPSSDNNVARAGGQNVQQSTRQMLNHTVNRPSAPSQGEVEPRRVDYDPIEPRRMAYNPIHQNGLSAFSLQNGPAAELVTIPSNRTIQGLVRNLEVPHQPTDNLSGREYLSALAQDESLGLEFRDWVGCCPVLGQTDLNDQQVNALAEKVRLVANTSRIDSDFKNRLEQLAREARDFPSDTSNYGLKPMWGEAVITRFGGQDNIDAVDLFNLGVAFCRLDLLRAEINRLVNLTDNQSVEAVQAIEYALQERLDLPTRHSPPHRHDRIPDARHLDELVDKVSAKLSANEGNTVMRFLSSWEPWANYARNTPKNKPDYLYMVARRNDQIQDFQNQRQEPTSYDSRLLERDYSNFIHNDRLIFSEWKSEIAEREAWALRGNAVANLLLDAGEMPAEFR